jgi:aspartyl protease family protein
MKMGRLIGLIVFFAVAAMTVPAFLTKNPEIVEDTAKATEELAETLPAAKKSALSGEERIDMNAQGHFIAQFRMNGRPVEAMVDTGATMVAINRSTARRLGINVAPADFKYSVSTANGQIKVARAVIQSIEFGGVRVRDVEAAVLDDRALEGTLLGMSFLRELRSFRVEDNELILKQ